MERICTSFFGKKNKKKVGGKDSQKNFAFFEMGNVLNSNSQRVPFVFKKCHIRYVVCVCLNKLSLSLSLSLSLLCSLLDDVFVITSSPSRDNSA